jgi:hypothetical protein
MPVPVLDDMQTALQVPAKLRLALNALQGEMPPELGDDGIHEALYALRGKLEEMELRELRRVGPQEYLLIKPLAPDAGGKFAEKAAVHVTEDGPNSDLYEENMDARSVIAYVATHS